MAYVKYDWNDYTWEKGQLHFQDLLNHMEDGIAAAGSGSVLVSAIELSGTSGTLTADLLATLLVSEINYIWYDGKYRLDYRQKSNGIVSYSFSEGVETHTISINTTGAWTYQHTKLQQEIPAYIKTTEVVSNGTKLKINNSGSTNDVVATEFEPVTGVDDSTHTYWTSIKIGNESRAIGGGSGTSDYESLSNKPKINSVELFGDKSAHDLGLLVESEWISLEGWADDNNWHAGGVLTLDLAATLNASELNYIWMNGMHRLDFRYRQDANNLATYSSNDGEKCHVIEIKLSDKSWRYKHQQLQTKLTAGTGIIIDDTNNKISSTIPSVINDKYLHTNSSTGALEWSTVDLSSKEDTANKKTAIADNDIDFPTSGAVVDYAETKANKVTAFLAVVDDTHYPSEKLVKDALDTKLNSLPTAINDRYLHTDSSTGVLEWVLIDLSVKEDLTNKVTSIAGYESSTTNYPTTKAIVDYVEKLSNKSDSYTESSQMTYASTKALVDGLDTKIDNSLKGVARGIATLNEDGKLNSSQLPSGISSIVNGYYYNSKFYEDSTHTIEIIPSQDKIYFDLSGTNKSYRWGGTVYVEISASLALGETSLTAYYGDKGKVAYEHSFVTTGNPHNVKFNEIEDRPSKLSVFTDDLGPTPVHTHSLYLTAHQDITGKENITNKVNTISSSSTTTEYASAKAVYNYHDAAKQDVLVSGTNIKSINGNSVVGSGNLIITGNVVSVNNKMGEVILNPDDLNDSSTANKFVTQDEKTNWNTDHINLGGHTVGINVPADAVFTDTRPKYNNVAVTNNTNIPEVRTIDWDGKYDKPASGIPKSDLATDVQTSLGLADTAIQSLADYSTTAQMNAAITAHHDNSKLDVINTTHQLSADLVDDTSTTNKFVTDALKLEWTNKLDALPPIENDKYLHTNESTGTLEWSEIPTLPVAPTAAGKYKLICDINESGVATYSWVKDTNWVLTGADLAITNP